MITQDRWEWFGYAGHLCVAHYCRFHLCTRVGQYLISSVGDYYPPHSESRETIGAGEDSFYETYVFKIVGVCTAEGCGCGMPTTDGHEIEGIRSGTPGETQAIHLQMCRKYAKRKE